MNSENTLREEIEDALSEVYDVREKLLEASKRISASTPGSEEYPKNKHKSTPSEI